MNRNLSIKLKALFLLVVFATNTAVGFACLSLRSVSATGAVGTWIGARVMAAKDLALYCEAGVEKAAKRLAQALKDTGCN